MCAQGGQEILTPYHFCGNDPVNSVDPTGLINKEPPLLQGDAEFRDASYDENVGGEGQLDGSGLQAGDGGTGGGWYNYGFIAGPTQEQLELQAQGLDGATVDQNDPDNTLENGNTQNVATTPNNQGADNSTNNDANTNECNDPNNNYSDNDGNNNQTSDASTSGRNPWNLGYPTMDQGGIFDNSEEFDTYMVNAANTAVNAAGGRVEVGAWQIADPTTFEGYIFVVQPWGRNDVNHTYNLFNYLDGYQQSDIMAEFHTHPGSTGPSIDDMNFSRDNNMPIYTIGADGSAYYYMFGAGGPQTAVNFPY